jgi:hypothetical protein
MLIIKKKVIIFDAEFLKKIEKQYDSQILTSWICPVKQNTVVFVFIYISAN